MTDFVYICRTGDNEELRYSIRSVLKIFPEAIIWVVGGKPSWYVGNYIGVGQDQDKYTNALNNLKAICESTEISESFILMNDDFFILKSFNLEESFHGGYLINKINRYSGTTRSSKYTMKLDTTYKSLAKKGIEDILDYELHVPMAMEKNKLNEIITKYPTLLWRSMYGNMYNLKGTEIKDVKFYSNPLHNSKASQITEDSIFISTQDESFKHLYATTFKHIFSEPSSLEL
jgi:hypothetical protein